MNKNVIISIKISVNFAPKGPINNVRALVQIIMNWRRPGEKPLSEPKMDRLPTHIWVTQPQWVNLTSRLIRTVLSCYHYGDVIMSTIASQITSLTIVYSTVYSDADKRKYQSYASLAFVRGIHRRPVNSPHKWPVTRKITVLYEPANYTLYLSETFRKRKI